MCVGNQGTVGGSIRRTARTERRARRESRTATISGSVGCRTRRGRRGSEVQPSSQAAPLRTVPTTFTRNSARVDLVFVCFDSMCERDTPALAKTCSASTRAPGRSLIENSISTRAESIATRAGGSVGGLATAAPDDSRTRAARSAPGPWLLRPTARAQAQARKGARKSMLRRRQMFYSKIQLELGQLFNSSCESTFQTDQTRQTNFDPVVSDRTGTYSTVESTWQTLHWPTPLAAGTDSPATCGSSLPQCDRRPTFGPEKSVRKVAAPECPHRISVDSSSMHNPSDPATRINGAVGPRKRPRTMVRVGRKTSFVSATRGRYE